MQGTCKRRTQRRLHQGHTHMQYRSEETKTAPPSPQRHSMHRRRNQTGPSKPAHKCKTQSKPQAQPHQARTYMQYTSEEPSTAAPSPDTHASRKRINENGPTKPTHTCSTKPKKRKRPHQARTHMHYTTGETKTAAAGLHIHATHQIKNKNNRIEPVHTCSFTTHIRTQRGQASAPHLPTHSPRNANIIDRMLRVNIKFGKR